MIRHLTKPIQRTISSPASDALPFSATRSILKQFQYVSDLHADYNRNLKLKPIAPNLIVAGDVCCNRTLKDLTTSFDHVYMVPGNHDLGMRITLDDNLNELYDISKSVSNLTILYNGKSVIDKKTGARIVGATLWSHIPKPLWPYYASRNWSFKTLNYRHNGQTHPFTPMVNNTLHRSDVIAIANAFGITFNEECNEVVQGASNVLDDNKHVNIVVTHYAPLIEMCCHKRYLIDRVASQNHAYCTDLSFLLNVIAKYNPFWIFGHTHYRTSFIWYQITSNNRVYLASNPLGFSKTPTCSVRAKTLDDTYFYP
jgi:predicted phosphodiesterase